MVGVLHSNTPVTVAMVSTRGQHLVIASGSATIEQTNFAEQISNFGKLDPIFGLIMQMGTNKRFGVHCSSVAELGLHES